MADSENRLCIKRAGLVVFYDIGMDDREAGTYWEASAEVWSLLARQGFDVYRDLVNTPAFLEMLPTIEGLRGLDLGCGDGHNTRLFAARGARMCGLDISPTFLRHARAAGTAIEYVLASGQSVPFRDGSFDFITACMSLMDMPDPEAALHECARVLRPGGFLQFSILHPCFFTRHRRLIRRSAVELAGYFDGDVVMEEWLFSAAPAHVKAGLRPFRLPVWHRPLSYWLNAIAAAGLSIEQTAEPCASPEVARAHPVVADTRIVAYFLHVRCRKATGV